MVHIEYAKLFNSISRFFKPSSRLEYLEKKYLSSMAQLGYLRDLKEGVLNPCYRGKKEVGRVELPKDFFSLLNVPNLNVEVWFLGDNSSSAGRDYAYRLRLLYDEVPLIEVLYGAVSGINEISVHGSSVYKCKVPDGFTLANFAEILTNGRLEYFVFKTCKLSKDDIQRINKWGLC